MASKCPRDKDDRKGERRKVEQIPIFCKSLMADQSRSPKLYRRLFASFLFLIESQGMQRQTNLGSLSIPLLPQKGIFSGIFWENVICVARSNYSTIITQMSLVILLVTYLWKASSHLE